MFLTDDSSSQHKALQTLVTLAWVTAGFLYHMGVTFQWAEVQLLAKLGGWEPHKDRQPGKITLMRGLSRLVEMLATQAMLSRYASEHEGLPPPQHFGVFAGLESSQ